MINTHIGKLCAIKVNWHSASYDFEGIIVKQDKDEDGEFIILKAPSIPENYEFEIKKNTYQIYLTPSTHITPIK